MTQWIEVSMLVDGEAAEAVAQELHRFCHQGVSVEQMGILPDIWDDGDKPPINQLMVRGYFADDHRAADTQAEIERIVGYLNMMYPMGTPVFSKVDDEDWANAWKKHYQPVRLGQRILIRPLWIEMEANPDDVVIGLDPGQAFGTGTHPTTQLCLEALEWLLKPGLDVLDLGCGSGILAIAAAKLGAGKIVAVDNDPVAVKATIENAEQNGVANQINAFEGSLENLITSARRFDLVVVNILARIIIPMCDNHLGDTVRPGGKAIFSGIINDQADDVEAALRRTGLNPIARHNQGDWVLIEAERPS